MNSEWFVVKHNGRWVKYTPTESKNIEYTDDEGEARLFYAPIWYDYWDKYLDAELVVMQGRFD